MLDNSIRYRLDYWDGSNWIHEITPQEWDSREKVESACDRFVELYPDTSWRLVRLQITELFIEGKPYANC